MRRDFFCAIICAGGDGNEKIFDGGCRSFIRGEFIFDGGNGNGET